MAVSSTDRVRAMRERRQQAIDAAAAAEVALRDAESLLAPAVEESLAALGLDGRDAAAAQLARQFAVIIDRAQDQAQALRWLGPELARVLAALGATPLARSKFRPAAPGPGRVVPSKVAQLRHEHLEMKAKRQRSAPGR